MSENRLLDIFTALSGTSQKSRYASALDPAFVEVEDRDIAAFIELAQEFAKDLKYINEADAEDGENHPDVAEVQVVDLDCGKHEYVA